jgi:hypothetical protein
MAQDPSGQEHDLDHQEGQGSAPQHAQHGADSPGKEYDEVKRAFGFGFLKEVLDPMLEEVEVSGAVRTKFWGLSVVKRGRIPTEEVLKGQLAFAGVQDRVGLGHVVKTAWAVLNDAREAVLEDRAARLGFSRASSSELPKETASHKESTNAGRYLEGQEEKGRGRKVVHLPAPRWRMEESVKFNVRKFTEYGRLGRDEHKGCVVLCSEWPVNEKKRLLYLYVPSATSGSGSISV